MFDGPGGLADRNARLEEHLANEIESAAARAFWTFCKADRGTPSPLPTSIKEA
jgi:hypothetical protein